MRIYRNVGPYHGRQPEPPKRAATDGPLLRQSSKQVANPDRFKFEPAPRGGRGDTEGNYWQPSQIAAYEGGGKKRR